MPNNILYDSQGDFASTKFMEYLIISVYSDEHERCFESVDPLLRGLNINW